MVTRYPLVSPRKERPPRTWCSCGKLTPGTLWSTRSRGQSRTGWRGLPRVGGRPRSLCQPSKRLSQPSQAPGLSPAYSRRVIRMAPRAEDHTIPLCTPREHPQTTAILKKVIFAVCDVHFYLCLKYLGMKEDWEQGWAQARGELGALWPP